MEKKETNEYKLQLAEREKKLINCQKEKNLNSCLKCDMIINCVIRNEYVKAVYNSMNKGQSGGFEF